jgi:hypothetical protein
MRKATLARVILTQPRHYLRLALLAVLCSSTAAVLAVPFALNNGPGDGKVSVGVDGYGAFGSSVGADSANAIYDPVGAIGPAGTSFESGVAIRFGGAGGYDFLTSGDIGGSGGLGSVGVAGTPLSGSSSFSFGGLSFTLVQTLTTLSSGTELRQDYTILNPSASSVRFELIRYLDGDLLFDGSLTDGGGRLAGGPGPEILFETDSATGSATSTTFVGITGEGGIIPAAGRYEIDSFSGLRSRIISGTALDDTVTGDGGDADQFIDAGGGYDVTLALRNLFDLTAGGSATYTTRTIFGSGTPDDGGGVRVPEGGSTLAYLFLMIGALGLVARRCKRSVA